MRVVDLSTGMNLEQVDALLASDEVEQSIEHSVADILQEVRLRIPAARASEDL